jgi:hypothetical protein
MKKVTPVKCTNRYQSAKRLETLVWAEVEKVLSQPEIVFRELTEQTAKNQASLWEKELETVSLQLANRGKQKARVWKAFELTGDEATFRSDIGTITKDIEQLVKNKAAIESQLEASKQFNPDMSDIKKACELVAKNAHSLNYEEKRLALRALQIRVLVDGDNIILKGIIPIPMGVAVDTSIQCSVHNTPLVFSFKIPVAARA